MLILDHPSQFKSLKTPARIGGQVVCTVGVFDGVHLGHKKIISAVVHTAMENKGTSVVITFSEHPYNVLNPAVHLPLLTSPEHKLMLLAPLGIDVCIMMQFTKATSCITAETWIKEFLWEGMHINTIYLGEDSVFGKDGKGDYNLLIQWGKQLGFKALRMEMLRIEKTPVSSTTIRNFITNGDLESAEKFLGRPYSIFGTPVKGMGIGKELGFPTINLSTQNQCIPPNGVYAVWANPCLGKKDNKIQAIANLGIRPTFSNTKIPILEVHLLSSEIIELSNPFDIPSKVEGLRVDTERRDGPRSKEQGLYAAEVSNNIEITFIKKVRNEVMFRDSKELAERIGKDVAEVKKIFSSL